MTDDELRTEMLQCPDCNPHTPYSAAPEFFDQWKIKHHFHPKDMTPTKQLTIVVEISLEYYERIKNIINLGDLLEKAVKDGIIRLINSQ
jgi:hypothetical protein